MIRCKISLEERPVMDPEIIMKSLRISRYGGDVFSLLQEARRR